MMTNPAEVLGPWRRGWTLDIHTTSSNFLGYDTKGREVYDTKRSPLGELVYQLKYRGRQCAPEIAAVMAEFFHDKSITLKSIDVIAPIPPSTPRAVQPVAAIAMKLGKLLHKPVVTDAIRKSRRTPGLKDIQDSEARRELLDGAFEVDRAQISGKGVLLLDDLYRSGATANAVTVALMGAGAPRVYFLAATRTRSNA